MTVAAGQDLTLYWNGTQLTGTSGSITRALKHLPEFSPFSQRPSGILVGAMDVLAEQGDPDVEAMVCRLALSHKAAGLASELAVERTLMDEMRAYQALLNPFAGAGTLRVDRSTAAGGAVSSEVPFARVVSVPRYGQGVLPSTATVEPTRGYLETMWELWCPLPYFYNRVATTTEVAAGNSTAFVSVNNGGVGPCGMRFQVKAGSVVGSPSQVTVTNATNGHSFIWRKLSGAFVAGDWIDWFSTDPRKEQHTGGTSPGSSSSPTGTDFMELTTGVNVVQAQRTGGTGSVVLELSFKPRYLSP